MVNYNKPSQEVVDAVVAYVAARPKRCMRELHGAYGVAKRLDPDVDTDQIDDLLWSLRPECGVPCEEDPGCPVAGHVVVD